MSKTETKRPKFSVAITTEKYQTLVRNTLSDPERSKRFIATITSAVAVNPALQECDAGTILAGGLLGESLNLSPSPQLGQFYLIPFECKVRGADGKILYVKDAYGNNITDDNGKWVPVTEKRAQFCLGYKGYVQLALRSGYYKRLNVVAVKDGEFVSFNPFEEELICHWITDDTIREKVATVGYAAMFEYLNGYKKIIYWTKEQMLVHADKYSPAFSSDAYKKIQRNEIPDKDMWKYSSFWYKNFDEMAKKTMLRQILSKWGVMSTELQSAYEKDSKVILDNNGTLDDDNGPFDDDNESLNDDKDFQADDNNLPELTTSSEDQELSESKAEKLNLDDI